MTTKKTTGNGSNDPKKLREKARELIEQAEELERVNLIKIGKLTMKYHATGFDDMTKFKKELEPLAGALS
jgi:hypothetical protein